MKKYSGWCIMALLCWVQCSHNEIPKEVHFLVEERMKQHYALQDSLCRKKALQSAEAAVDSFFLSIRRQYLHDSIAVPPKPIRPVVDTNISLDISKPVKPLWDSLKVN
jgi:hypothetical protein